jgi:hypothetical protein
MRKSRRRVRASAARRRSEGERRASLLKRVIERWALKGVYRGASVVGTGPNKAEVASGILLAKLPFSIAAGKPLVI